jgi:hypothetical protein
MRRDIEHNPKGKKRKRKDRAGIDDTASMIKGGAT